MKKNLFFFFGLFFFVFSVFAFSSSLAFAQDPPLETTYPSLGLPPAEVPTTTGTPLPIYVRYLYYFFVGIVGLVSLGAIVMGGFRYLTSAGNPAILKDARDQILVAFLGLVILLGSYLILTTVNPQLAIFEIGPWPPAMPDLNPGVLLCREQVAVYDFWRERERADNLLADFFNATGSDKQRLLGELIRLKTQLEAVKKEIEEKCFVLPSSTENFPREFAGKIEWAYLIPNLVAQTDYGVILYERSRYVGKAIVLYVRTLQTDWCSDRGMSSRPCPVETAGYELKIRDLRPSSAKPFILDYKPAPDIGVTLYELIDFNRADENAWSRELGVPPSNTCPGGEPNNTASCSNRLDSGQTLGSVSIEGRIFVVFFRQGANPWDGDIDVFTTSDSNLYDNPIATWCWNPCAERALVVSASIIQ